MADRREIVSDYIQRGWVPFGYTGQFTPPGGWQRSQVTDDTLDEIAKSDKPIGLLLGKVSNLVVVDLDKRNGGDARRFMERYGLKPNSTRVHSSASPGSFHMLFKFPEGLDSLQKTKGERTGVPELAGVDLLADGSHILAPPTVRVGHPEKPDGQYTVKVDTEVAELPAALLVDWLAAVTRQTPDGKPVGHIATEDIDHAVWLHKRNVEIAASAVEGTRDDVCTARIGSSLRIALALPDVVLSVEQVRDDFEHGVPYEIKDLDGKVRRGAEWAEQHAWKELTQPEGELPDGIPPDKAGEFFEELNKLRLKDAAKRAFDLEKIERDAAYVDVGPIHDGSVFMANKPKNPDWVVDGLVHHGGSSLLLGKYKSGKSTLMLNLIKALTTGSTFLGRFNIPKALTVAYVDMELGDTLAWKWLAEMSGIDYSRLVYVPRVGLGKQLNMRSEQVRANTARMLREKGVDVMILDPMSPVISALGMEENGNEAVRPLLDSFDMLKAEAELKAVVISHHTGHQDQTRARGASAFMDWPASFFSVVPQGETYDAERHFQAGGRDVNVHSTRLLFNSTTRELALENQSPISDAFEMGPEDEEVPW